MAGVFVGGGDAFAVGLEFAFEGLAGGVAGAEDDVGLDDFAAHFFGDADGGGFEDGGVFLESGFDFGGSDAVAGGIDDVIGAADEVEEAVGVAVAGVAGEVVIADDAAGGFLGIFPVFGIESDGALGFDANGDLAGFSVGQFAAVIIDDGDLEAGGRLAHGAGGGFGHAEAAEATDEADHFGLSVAFADGQTGAVFPGLGDGGVEGFAGGDAMTEAGEAAGGEVFADEESECGGGCAEDGDGVAFEGFEDEGGVEFAAHIEAEDGGALDPGAVEIGPGGFSPAVVGESPDHFAGGEVEPVFSGDGVSEAVGDLGVEDHFGVAGGAGGEVDDAGVGGFGGFVGGGFGCGGEGGFKGQPAGEIAIDDEAETGEGGIDFGGVLGVHDDGGNFGDLQAIGDVFGGEEGRAGDGYGADADEAEHGDPPFGHAGEDDQDAIAATDALGGEECCGFAGEPGHGGEGEFLFMGGGFVGPPERNGVGEFRAPAFHDVMSEVVVLRHLAEGRCKHDGKDSTRGV